MLFKDILLQKKEVLLDYFYLLLDFETSPYYEHCLKTSYIKNLRVLDFPGHSMNLRRELKLKEIFFISGDRRKRKVGIKVGLRLSIKLIQKREHSFQGDQDR